MALPIIEAVGGRLLGGLGARMAGGAMMRAGARMGQGRLGTFLASRGGQLASAEGIKGASSYGMQAGFQHGLNVRQNRNQDFQTDINTGGMY